jgi:hypothetical protein
MKYITVKLTDNEYEGLVYQAKVFGLDFNEFLRHKVVMQSFTFPPTYTASMTTVSIFDSERGEIIG